MLVMNNHLTTSIVNSGLQIHRNLNLRRFLTTLTMRYSDSPNSEQVTNERRSSVLLQDANIQGTKECELVIQSAPNGEGH